MSHTETASMDAETLEALKGSITKWELVLAGKENGNCRSNCPLCTKFYRDGCQGCPVFKSTGREYCSGSPYKDYIRACNASNPNADALAQAALAELNFLKSLLPVESHVSDEELRA